MENYKYSTWFVINTVLDQRLPSEQLQSLLEWTSTGLEQFLAEFYTILSEKQLQFA
jgi:hypothetical protein